MGRPETIERYLGELDDALEVTLSRRERILAELRNDLDEAAEEEQLRGASRKQAERHAISALGIPAEKLAADFPVDGATLIGRVAVSLADFIFVAGRYLRRPENRRWAVKSTALLGLAYGLVAVIWSLTDTPFHSGLPGPELAIQALVTGLATSALVAASVAWWGARSLPPPGYGRRWLKLQPAARARVLRAVREGEALANPDEASFAEELHRRVRDFRPPGRMCQVVWSPVALAVLGSTSGDLTALPAALTVVVSIYWFASRGRRSLALDLAEGELVICEVIEQATYDALRHAAPLELGDEQLFLYAYSNLGSTGEEPGYVLFSMRAEAERSWSSVPITLVARKRTVELAVRGEDEQRLRFEREDPHEMRELRLELAAAIAARWQHDALPVSLPSALSGPWAGRPLLDGPDLELLPSFAQQRR